MKLKAFAALSALTIGTTAVFAHGGATGIVKERMDNMSAIAAHLKAVAPMVRGSVAVDFDAIETAMRDIAMRAEHLPMMFPEGTGDAPSEAGPAIWSDPDGFAALFSEMSAAATHMATVAAGEDSAALGSAFGKLAGTCKACHSDYRISRD